MNKAFEFRADSLRELVVQLPDLLMSAGMTACLERRMPNYKLVGKDPERPDIDSSVIGLTLESCDHLRGQVVQSATHGLSSV